MWFEKARQFKTIRSQKIAAKKLKDRERLAMVEQNTT